MFYSLFYLFLFIILSLSESVDKKYYVLNKESNKLKNYFKDVPDAKTLPKCFLNNNNNNCILLKDIDDKIDEIIEQYLIITKYLSLSTTKNLNIKKLIKNKWYKKRYMYTCNRTKSN